MSAEGIVVDCSGCGRTFRVKPVLAGKRFGCKCGVMLDVPMPQANGNGEVGAGLAGPDTRPDAGREPEPMVLPPDDLRPAPLTRRQENDRTLVALNRLARATLFVFLAVSLQAGVGALLGILRETDSLGSTAKILIPVATIALEILYLFGLGIGLTVFKSTDAHRFAVGAFLCRIIGLVLIGLAVLLAGPSGIEIDRRSTSQALVVLGGFLLIVSNMVWICFHQAIGTGMQEYDLRKAADRVVLVALITFITPLLLFAAALIGPAWAGYHQVLNYLGNILTPNLFLLFFVMYWLLVARTRYVARTWS